MILKKRYEDAIRLWVKKFKFEYNKVCSKEYLFPLCVDISLKLQTKYFKILTIYPYTKHINAPIYYGYSCPSNWIIINILLDNGLSDLIEEQIEILKKNWDSLNYWESLVDVSKE